VRQPGLTAHSGTTSFERTGATAHSGPRTVPPPKGKEVTDMAIVIRKLDKGDTTQRTFVWGARF
jgi:hypothetical protein